MLSGQAAGEQGGWSGAEPLGVGVLRDPGKGPQGWHVADIMGLDGQGHWGVHEPNGASPRSSQRCRVVGERAGTLDTGCSPVTSQDPWLLSLQNEGYIKEWMCAILVFSVFCRSQFPWVFSSYGFSCGERLRRRDAVK